jgi:hypothetical protein
MEQWRNRDLIGFTAQIHESARAPAHIAAHRNIPSADLLTCAAHHEPKQGETMAQDNKQQNQQGGQGGQQGGGQQKPGQQDQQGGQGGGGQQKPGQQDQQGGQGGQQGGQKPGQKPGQGGQR